MTDEHLTMLERIAVGIEEQNRLAEEAQDDYRTEKTRRVKQANAEKRERDQGNAEARRVMRDREQRDIEAHEARMVEHRLKVEEFELTAQALGLRLRAPDYVPTDISKENS